MYREAFEILNAIKGENKKETIDLKTSAISNIRRERLSSVSLTKEDLGSLLKTLIECYSKIYVPKEEASYYAGINLAYMLVLLKILFPQINQEISKLYSIEQIYKDVQKFILQAKSSMNSNEIYYASMSELEFKLLINPFNKTQKLELLLEECNPSFTLVHQTQRQIKEFFIEIIEKFSEEKYEEVKAYHELLSVFDAYKKSKIQ